MDERAPESELPGIDSEMPCIRCGACIDACPERLQPQRLLSMLRSQDFAGAQDEGVFDCSECGRCDPVCPSRIPLLRTFRDGKQEIRQRERQLATADAARERYQSRQLRLQREAIESAARLSERKSKVAGSDAVAAALERAKARRQSKGTESEP